MSKTYKHDRSDSNDIDRKKKIRNNKFVRRRTEKKKKLRDVINPGLPSNDLDQTGSHL